MSDLAKSASTAESTRSDGTGSRLPSDYTIGPDDALTVMVWREKDLSMDVTVRPDGYVTLPLVNDIQAAGLKPEQLRVRIDTRLRAFIKDPIVTVMVRQVNSRKVFITGKILKPGAYPLLTPLRAVDLIAIAGGVLASADSRHISILRSEPEGRVALPMDYTRVSRGEVLWQDVILRPGDAIVVP